MIEIAPYILFGTAIFVVVIGWHTSRMVKHHSHSDARAILIMACVMAACQIFTGLHFLWRA